MEDLSVEFEVKDFKKSKTRNNDTMGNLTLINCQTKETLNCKLWESYLNEIPEKHFRAGNIVKITDGDYNEQYKNCIVKSLELIKEASIGLSEDERQSTFNKMLEVIESLKSVDLRGAIKQVVMENKGKYIISPAAKNHHHNYVGGLMVHTLECIDYAKALFPATPSEINHELVLAGCIMHDFGKAFEYDVDLETGLASIDDDWQKIWISHIHWGFCWANTNGFHDLAHIIASHHGIKEHGALVEPNSREAEMVHEVDMLSSRLGRIKTDQLEKSAI